MARETKIGLLVGMGFIVCFAIILSNRGADNPANIRRSLPRMADATEASDPLGQAERRARDYSSRTQVGHQRGTPVRTERDPRSETPQIAHPERLGGTPVEPSHGTPSPTLSDIINLQPTNKPAAPPPVREVVAPPRRPTPELKGRDKLTATRPDEASEQEIPPAPAQTYTVTAGDSLSKIARTQYGTSRKDVVDALFKANRDTLQSPDRVQVGQTLVLPEIEGVTRKPGATNASTPRSRKADRSQENKKAKKTNPPASNKTWRWYQVRKGDRYETIARRELGDARRWKEIHELNKTIFPDSSRIRWGVRIKIPVDPKR